MIPQDESDVLVPAHRDGALLAERIDRMVPPQLGVVGVRVFTDFREERIISPRRYLQSSALWLNEAAR